MTLKAQFQLRFLHTRHGSHGEMLDGTLDGRQLQILCVQYAVGFACTLPLAFSLEPIHVSRTPELAWALAYLVIGNSILAISLLLMLIR